MGERVDTQLFLMRHGESTWNAERRWQGQADPPLSSRGREQARSAAAALAALGSFTAVVPSPLRRAFETAEIVGPRLGVAPGAPVPALMERGAGAWEGMTQTQIEMIYPAWLTDGRRPPGYESDADLAERAAGALADVAFAHPGTTVLVVTHGGTIGALERKCGMPVRHIENLEGRWFVHDGTDLRTDGIAVRLAGAMV